MDDLTTDIARVRSVLLRELETINSYEELARQASSDEVRSFFLHLAKEEKEHVAEATVLLRRMDADQEAYFQKEYSASHFNGEPAALTVDGLGPSPIPAPRASSPSPAVRAASSGPPPGAASTIPVYSESPATLAAGGSSAYPASSPSPSAPKRPALSTSVEDLRLPADPRRVPYALPSPPSTFASELTVGTLRRKGP